MNKFLTYFSRKKSKGLTMIELLIVVVILAVLIMILMWAMRGQTYKARDAKRKADLDAYEKTFEQYFNDKDRYPLQGDLDNCGTSDLDPYLNKVLCDPVLEEPYDHITDDDGTYYAICTDLENDSDPDIENGGCLNGCGTDGDYDYCVTVGISISDLGGSLGGGGGGGVDLYPGPYACDPNGICNNYGIPNAQLYCPRSWVENDCQNLCGIPANRCSQ
ncbi:type IV pilin protein [Patescibacteria group bacterium]